MDTSAVLDRSVTEEGFKEGEEVVTGRGRPTLSDPTTKRHGGKNLRLRGHHRRTQTRESLRG